MINVVSDKNELRSRSYVWRRGLVLAVVIIAGWSASVCYGAVKVRVYEMGESDPGAVIGGSSTETLDILSAPDDGAGALVPLANPDGAKYVEGRDGPGSLAIDFTGSEFLFSDSFDPRNFGSFSVMSQGWVKPDSALSGTRQTLWALGDDLGSLVINESNVWEAVINGGGGPGFVVSSAPVVYDDWTQVAIARFGGGVEVYVNGTIVASVGGFWNTPGLFVSAGADNLGFDGYDGAIDDFNIAHFGDGIFNVATDVDFWEDTDFSDVLGDVDPSQDGLVNDLDYLTWSANVGFDNGFGAGDPGTLVRGDADQNGRVNYFDFQIIYEQAALNGSPLTLPEPSGFVLVLGAAVLVGAWQRRRGVACVLAATVAISCLFVNGSAQADVVVSDDFFYNQPTKSFDSGIGFAFQDYAGGQNGPAGNWIGRWAAVGGSIITGPDYMPVEDQFMVGAQGIFDAQALVRDYSLTGLASDQTLYFSIRMRNEAAGFDPMTKLIINAPGDENAEISMGFESLSFSAALGTTLSPLGITATDDNVMHQLVGQLEINANGDNERLTVWIDPTGVMTGPDSVTVEADVVTGIDAFTGEVSLEMGAIFHGNTSWWDDVAIGTAWEDVATLNVPRLTLRVNPTSGNVMLVNGTGTDFDLSYLEMQSESGALDPGGWSSLADQGTDGGAWMENNPSANALIESNFGGATTLAGGSQLNLGQAFNTSGMQDVVARFGTDLGLLNLAAVEYVSLPSGDFNGDGEWDMLDINALTAAVAGMSTDLGFDMNEDGVIDLNDITAENVGWLAVGGSQNPDETGGNPFLEGDSNLDGSVDVSDFNNWNGAKFTSVAAWSSGDFNANGSVDVSDFNLWNGNKFTSSDPGLSSVPEPGALCLIGAGLFAVLFQRRR